MRPRNRGGWRVCTGWNGLGRLLGLLAVLALLPAPVVALGMTAAPPVSHDRLPAAMPCHEPAAPLSVGDGAGTLPMSAPAPHLCCALACLVVAPPLSLPLSPPARVRVAWHCVPAGSLVGRPVELPEPPPRSA